LKETEQTTSLIINNIQSVVYS